MTLVAQGTPIAVIAPSSAYDPERLARGLEMARAAGHDPRPFPGMLEPDRYLAASDDARLRDLHEALTSPEYGAVWMVRGGYGLTRLLDRLELSRLERRPVIGFSDVTALHVFLHQHGLGPAIHGPMPHSLPSTDEASTEHFWRLLAGEQTEPMHGRTWVSGSVRAPLVGGNLCMLASTCGTSAQLDARGCILVLEEVGEYAYRIDRTLQQLRSSGVLDGVAGVAVGAFTSCHVPDGVTWKLRDVLMDHLGDLGVPVVGGLPIGHGAQNRAFVYGAQATLADGMLS